MNPLLCAASKVWYMFSFSTTFNVNSVFRSYTFFTNIFNQIITDSSQISFFICSQIMIQRKNMHMLFVDLWNGLFIVPTPIKPIGMSDKSSKYRLIQPYSRRGSMYQSVYDHPIRYMLDPYIFHLFLHRYSTKPSIYPHIRNSMPWIEGFFRFYLFG